ncbi:hypothetical protein BG011_005012 [Mortierella polycephala]|uniref:Major facilitator superfamily (MFS) profile domain-containing protein n=1 Tax=Mortierella polycephala TaxID=41804 RepID=A0A9P6QEF6_9FUNG|nr:hypothetical protein BG011_005012 [Mortierella polycephala]
MSDPMAIAPVKQEDSCTKSDSYPSSSLVHQDSELTISNEKNHTNEGVDVEQASAAIDPLEEPTIIDGPPYGWVVVFAACLSQMISMGTSNIYGVFQNFYYTNAFKDTASTFELAWVGALSIMALDIAGPFTGSISDHFGHRQSALAGVVVMTLSLVAAAFSTKVWQLYLSQGILYGFGASLTYFSSLALPSQWFIKNRGFVTGIAISGGGFGGLWLSPVISSLLNAKGMRFTLVALAITHIVILTPACMLFKTRIESGRERMKRIKRFGYRKGESLEQDKKRKFVDFSILKNTRFCLLFVAGIFIVTGYFTPFYFINSYATQHGVETSTASLMVGIMNGCSAVGRIVMGLVSDKIGYINALFLSTFAATCSLFFIWTFAKTVEVMFVFSVVYGLSCGAYLSSTVSVSGAICGQDRLATVTGIIYAGMAVGSLVGSPASGAILDSIGGKTDYTAVILFAGSVMLIGTAILLVMKYLTNKNMFVKV